MAAQTIRSPAMGIAVCGGKRGPVSDPNIVPLIDVLLVLIIIFMVITPSVPTGLPALVPTPESKPEPVDPRIIVVQVMQNGKLMINQDRCDWDALSARLSDIFKDRADKVAFLKGDEEVPFAQVARAIDLMRGAGIDHVGLITPRGNVEGKAL
jgi:biopolymer transport protein ExbD